MMDFNFGDGTEAESLRLLFIAPIMKFNFRDVTEADALRALRMGLRKENR